MPRAPSRVLGDIFVFRCIQGRHTVIFLLAEVAVVPAKRWKGQ